MTPAELLEALGGHPTLELGLRTRSSQLSGDDDTLDRWFVACCLLGQKVEPTSLASTLGALEEAGLGHPAAIAKAGPLAVESSLISTRHAKPEQAAQLLARLCAALQDRHGGSLATLAHGADDLEDLAGRLMGLASGFGRAGVARLLRPLRDTWPLADELPLDPGARVAAVHLGWIREGEDEDGAPGSLRAFLRSRDGEPDAATHFCDVEAALERLGRRACLRDRPERCPLGDQCPQRS